MPTTNDSASGASYSSGSAAALTRNPGVLSASGASLSDGDATTAVSLPLGAMSDFGVWDPTGVDPAISCLLATGAGAPNARAYAAATAPAAYTTALGVLWNGAVNTALRATWNSSIATAITDGQIEVANVGNLLPVDAADYRGRLCYTKQLHDAVVSRSQDRPLTGAWCGKLVNSSSDPVTVTTYAMWPLDVAMAPCVPGDLVHGSVYVALPRAGAQWTAGLHFYDSSRNPIGTWSMTAYATHPGGYAYQQSTADATAPAGTAYVAVAPHIVAAAANDGEVAYADCHRVTSGIPALSVAPSPFTPARQQTVTVRSNRTNLAANPSLATGTYGYWATGGTSPSFTWDSTVGRALPGAAKLVATYSGGTTFPQIGTRDDAFASQRGLPRLAPGGVYTASAWIQLGAGCPPVVITAQIDGSIFISGTDTSAALSRPELQDSGWLRVYLTFTVPDTSSGNTSIITSTRQSTWTGTYPTVTYWQDDLLVERTPLLLDYFDGGEASPDYLWEGTANQSPSHYYRDFRALQYRLNGLVAQAVPLGVPYQILYAQPDS